MCPIKLPQDSQVNVLCNKHFIAISSFIYISDECRNFRLDKLIPEHCWLGFSHKVFNGVRT